ncbi:MAG: hypothetical protein KY453_09490 [Gemmatimonadetes bacterium]|nr:hypothetical protein [Gemmatimonadota bacterium]
MAPRAALLVALVAAAGCASGGDPGSAASSPGARGAAPGADGDLVRRIEPFTVQDADGRPYQLPFLGGLNVPRPQWVDVDGDGDLDLFVQEYTDRLMFFERLPDRDMLLDDERPDEADAEVRNIDYNELSPPRRLWWPGVSRRRND